MAGNAFFRKSTENSISMSRIQFRPAAIPVTCRHMTRHSYVYIAYYILESDYFLRCPLLFKVSIEVGDTSLIFFSNNSLKLLSTTFILRNAFVYVSTFNLYSVPIIEWVYYRG